LRLPLEAVGFSGECRFLVMQGDHADRAQDRLAQPAQAEQNEQEADDVLQHMDRYQAKKRTEDGDERRQGDEGCRRAEEGGAPALDEADGEHDREGLHHLDERSEKRGGQRRYDGDTVHGLFDIPFL
jgi:hypothetical protein